MKEPKTPKTTDSKKIEVSTKVDSEKKLPKIEKKVEVKKTTSEVKQVPVKIVKEVSTEEKKKKLAEKEKKEKEKELKDLEPKLESIRSEVQTQIKGESTLSKTLNFILKTTIVVGILLSFMLNFVLIDKLKGVLTEKRAVITVANDLQQQVFTKDSENQMLKLEYTRLQDQYTSLEQRASQDKSKIEQIGQILGTNVSVETNISPTNVVPVPPGMQP